MPAKRVIHLIPNLNSGGCENQLLRLLPRVKGWQHSVVTLLEEGTLASDFRRAGITVVNLDIGNFGKFWRYGRILRYLRQSNPNRIITYLFVPDLLGRLFVKPLTHFRPTPFLRSTYQYPAPTFVFIRFIERLTRPLVQSYLANSQAVKHAFVNSVGVPAHKITVIPNGIDLEKFKQIGANSNKRKELNLTPEDFVITCVANFHISKNQKYLIEALSLVVPAMPNIHLLLVGSGEEENNLRDQAKNLKVSENIHFLGRRSDVSEILGISSIFVLPTSFEGMSNALMEAMAVGLPCIATDIEPNRELIENGKNGQLVPTENSQALADQILFLADKKDVRTDMGRAARQTIKDYYDIDIVAKKFENYLNS